MRERRLVGIGSKVALLVILAAAATVLFGTLVFLGKNSKVYNILLKLLDYSTFP